MQRNEPNLGASRGLIHLAAIVIAVFSVLFHASAPEAEYADVILNKHSDTAGVRPVIFSHWFHRIRFRCKVCHHELGFEMRAGANNVTMNEIINGKFCGMCHNGQIAWNTENCDLCHSGRPGLGSRVVGGHQTGGPGIW